MAKISVILAEDHDLVRAGFKSILQTVSDIQVCGEAEDGVACLELVEAKEPDVILLDVSMPRLSGMSAIKQLKAQSPESKILVLTAAETPTIWQEVLVSGADGVALKSISKKELVSAIKEVAEGENDEPFVHSKILQAMPHILQQVSFSKQLSAREKQVIKLVAEGLRTKEIAEVLGISDRTVSKHRENIMIKMGLDTPADMANYATQSGLTLLELDEIS